MYQQQQVRMKCYSSTVKLLLLLHTTTSAIALDKSSRLRGTTTSNSNINHPPASSHDDEQHRRSLQTTTASNAISCPPPGTTTELTSLSTTGGTLTLPTIRTIGQLCTLTKQVTSINDYDDTTIVPLARSYDNESWSYAAGETPAVMLSSNNNNGFSCFVDGGTSWEYCSVDLPPLDVSNTNGGEVYVLTTYEHSLSERDQVSRFLSLVSSMYVILDDNIFSAPVLNGYLYIYIISKLIK